MDTCRSAELRGSLVVRARLCSSVVRSAFGRDLCGVRLVLVRVAFVRGGRSRGGSQGEAECGGLWTTDRPQQDMGTGAPRQAADLGRAPDGRITGGTRTHNGLQTDTDTDWERTFDGLLTDGRQSRSDRPTTDF